MQHNFYDYNYWYDPIYQNGGHPHWRPDWHHINGSPYPVPEHGPRIQDHGGEPFVVNIEEASKQNATFRTALWTGNHLQVTVMSIGVGEDIGLEIHPHTDQFLRIEDGMGIVQMGETEHHLDFHRRVGNDDAIMIPAGMWHNVTNTGRQPLKLYSIYAPPHHPFGTVHGTKAIAEEEEDGHPH